MPHFARRATALLLLALAGGALGASPARAAYVPDGDYDCDGGFYSLLEYAPAGGRLVKCLGLTAGSRGWMRLSLEPRHRAGEGAAGATTAVSVQVAHDAPNSTPLPVRVRTAGGTATPGVDYVPLDTVVLIPRGQLSTTIDLQVLGDDVREGDETVELVGEYVAGTSLSPGGATVTLVDDDAGDAADEGVAACAGGGGSLDTSGGQALVRCDAPQAGNPTFAVTAAGPAHVVERRFGTAYAQVALRRAEARTAVPVHFEAVGETATAGTDFRATAGDVVLRAGETERTVRVPIPKDENQDASYGDYAEDVEGPETFRLELSAPAGSSTVTTSSAPITIQDSDIAPLAVPAPSVSGRPLAGATLTAGDGAWLNGVPKSRQWQRCEAGGGACADIAGATGATYVPGEDDAGRELRVVVRAEGDPPFRQGPAFARVTSTPSARTAAVTALLPVWFATRPAATVTEGDAVRFVVDGAHPDATLECRVDDGAWESPCPAADRTLTGLGVGAHRYAARQRLDGLVPAEAAWEFEIVAAPVVVDPPPGGGGGTPDPDPDPDPVPDPDPDPVPDPVPVPGGPALPLPDVPALPLPLPLPLEPQGERPGATPPPAPSAPMVAPVAPLASALTPQAAPAAAPLVRAAAARRLTTALSDDGVRLGAWCAERCAVTATLTVTAKDARRLGLTSRTVGRASGSAPANSRAHLRVRFTRQARRALGRTGRTVRVTVTIAGADGPQRTTLTLRA